MSLVELLNKERWLTLIELFLKGGWMMWVILAIFVIAMAITLDRFFVLYLRARLNVDRFLDSVTALIETREYVKALETCNLATRHPLPNILKAGIAKSNRREKEIERAMELEVLRAVPYIRKGVNFLSLLGKSAIFLGVIGMVLGLIRLFSSVSAAKVAMRHQVLTAGISTAMYTIAFGLIVAVLVLFAHRLISGRVEKMNNQMERGMCGLLVSLASRMRDPQIPTSGKDRSE